MSDLNALIDRQVKGFTLQQEFYRDPAIFERDISRIHLRHWLCYGRIGRAKSPCPGSSAWRAASGASSPQSSSRLRS